MDKNINFPNTELLLDKQNNESFAFIDSKKENNAFHYLSQTPFNANHI